MAKRNQQNGNQKIGARPTAVAPVPLSGTLSEFRDALTAEIEAAKRASSSGAIPVANGHLLGTLGTGFQYLFDIESALDLPGDAPGELRLPNRDPIRVSVVAFEGLSITLNTEIDLGRFVPIATLQSDMSMLLLKLIERIEKKATLANPAGDRLLGSIQPQGSGERVTTEQLAQHGFELNEEQRKAVGSVLGRDTTYIWGPPGTGKTHTIGAIGAELFQRGKSLLVVSHTNTAVDGAILEIGNAVRRTAPDEVENGLVIRVGTPKDARLKSPENAAFLLSNQRERRQAQLAETRTALIAERDPLLDRERQLSLIIELHGWLSAAELDMVRFQGDLARLERICKEAVALRDQQRQLEQEVHIFQTVEKSLEAAVRAEQHEEEVRARVAASERELDESTARLGSAIQLVTALEVDLVRAAELEPHRAEYAKLPTISAAEDALSHLLRQEQSSQELLAKAEGTLKEAQRFLSETEEVNWITRKWKGLPDPDAQRAVVNESIRAVRQFREAANTALGNRHKADDTLRAIKHLSSLLKAHAALPSLSEMKRQLDEANRQVQHRRLRVDVAVKARRAADSEFAGIQQVLSEFRLAHRCEPHDLAKRAQAVQSELNAVLTDRRDKLAEERRAGDKLVSELGRGVALLRDLGFATENPTTPEAMYAVLAVGVQQARYRAGAIPMEEAERERRDLISRLKAIAGELEAIEEALRRVEESVIREARVVGATLTASFLRDAIQMRRFDTVLLDEASMAAIPALWMAASLCDRSLVVVGDYHQLPPVVVSKDELALKWLGRDPFQLVDLTHEGPKPEFFVGLREQHRMHPHVSSVANMLIYNGVLLDHPSTTSREADPIPWLSSEWLYNDPLLLVDTGCLNAWVTPVSRGGGNSSRLNFISATVCADIASLLLAPDRVEWNRKGDPRVLVISPYRPHSRLISLLLKDDGIESEVVAGTVHTFQGSQADTVILDLVNDEPHWKVGHFMAQTDNQTARLFNVAITRAKRRLIVVGDFDYCEKVGKKAFLGKKLIPYLRAHHKLVSAMSVVPEGIATRAARAHRQVFGGSIQVEHERCIVRQDRFYSMLAVDLEAATTRVVIYSPFITQARMGEIETQLKAAVERRVAVVVVTKPLQERDKRERPTYRMLENALAEWQVSVVHKRGMHEKLVLIDSHTVWTGSLNPLSFRDTQEVMERRRSAEVFEEYAKTLMLQELLDEYSAGRPSCPICDGEIVAAEGGSTPFYWRCVNEDCPFRRGVDDDTIKDGDVRCHKCQHAVKLVDKDNDGRARWVCTENPRHKQLVRPMHLRLAKVRERFSATRLERLEKRFTAQEMKAGKVNKKRAERDTLFG